MCSSSKYTQPFIPEVFIAVKACRCHTVMMQIENLTRRYCITMSEKSQIAPLFDGLNKSKDSSGLCAKCASNPNSNSNVRIRWIPKTTQVWEENKRRVQ